MCVFMCYLLYVPHMCAMPTENGVGYSATEVTDGLSHNVGLGNQTEVLYASTL